MTVIRESHVRNHFVYRAYDKDGRLLYIGCTHDMKKRWESHRRDNPHWVEITTALRMSGPYNFDTARAKERADIEEFEPVYNTNARRYAEFMAKKRWVDQRSEELIGDRSRTELSIEERIEIMRQIDDEANDHFPGVWNSHNHPLSGVPERYQPAPPRP